MISSFSTTQCPTTNLRQESAKTITAPHEVKHLIPTTKVTPAPQQTRVAFETTPTNDTNADLPLALKLREEQVLRINSTATRTTATRIPWPAASKTLTDLWTQRHAIHKTLSHGHMKTQARMLFLLDVPPNERWQRFELECFRRSLSPTCAETYWGAYIAVVAILGTVTHDDKKVASLLKKRANAFPTRFPHPMSEEHVAKMLKVFDGPYATLIAFAWLTGQRLSDMLLLLVNNITITPERITVKVTAGKVLHHIPPYIIVIQRESLIANRFLQCLQNAKAAGRMYLMLNDAEDETRQSARQACAEILTEVSPDLEIRSIRRGGLQRMASLNLPLTDILLYSQHRDEAMLLRYLNYGAASAQRTEALAHITTLMNDSLTTKAKWMTTM